MEIRRILPYSLPHNPFRQFPLLRYLLCLASGIVLSHATQGMAYHLLSWVIAAFVSGLFLLFMLCRKLAVESVVISGLLCVFFCGGSLCALEYEKVRVEWPTTRQAWQGQIEQVYKVYDDGVGVEVRLIGGQPAFQGKLVRICLREDAENDHRPTVSVPAAESSSYPSLIDYSSGNILFFSSVINKGYVPGNPGDFDYPGYLSIHGISGAAYAPSGNWKVYPVDDESVSWRHRLRRFRQLLVESYQRRFPTDASGLLSALTLGDKTLLTPSVRSVFSESGTSHVLALSGLHLGILFSIFHFLLLKRLRGKKQRAAGIFAVLLFLWFFVFLAGAPISLLRAASMLTLLQLAQVFRGSRQLSINGLCFAALVLLLYNPHSLFDVSFQLSFSSVFSILLCNIYIWQRYPLPYFELSYEAFRTFPGHRFDRLFQLTVKRVYQFFVRTIYPFFTISLSAQLGTFALVAVYFHSISPYFFIANIIAIPCAYLLLTGSLCYILVPWETFREPLSRILQHIIALMTQGLESITHWPGAVLSVYAGRPLLLSLTLLLPALYVLFEPRFRPWRLRSFCVVVTLLSVGIWSEVYRLRPHRLPPQIIVYNVPRTTVVHFIQSARESYLYSPEPSDSVSPRLETLRQNFFLPLHMRPPRWLSRDNEQYTHLVRRGNVLLFGKYSLVVLDKGITPRPGVSPRPVDILLLSGGCATTPADVLRCYRPHHVVLSPTLRPSQRSRWTTHCRSVRQPCHDVSQSGAFTWPASQSRPRSVQ